MADNDATARCEDLHDPIPTDHIHLFRSDGGYAHSISKAGLQPLPVPPKKDPLE